MELHGALYAYTISISERAVAFSAKIYDFCLDYRVFKGSGVISLNSPV